MTSEIRANTLKNRVGLGTVSFTNTGIVVSGIVTANSFSGTVKATNLTSDRVVFTTTNGQLEASGNLTYNGTTLASGSPVDINADLDVDGHTNLDNVSIAGVSTVTTFLQVLGSAGTSDKGLEVRANSTQNTDTNQAIRVRNNSNTDTFKVSYKGYVNNRVTELTEHLTTPTTYLGDSIIHHGDLDTKIRFPGADTFSIETGGNEAFRISYNRIGLNGTVPPNSHANVTSSIHLADSNTILSRTGNQYFALFQNLKYTAQDAVRYLVNGYASAYAQNAGSHRFFTVGNGTANTNATVTERLRITNDGKTIISYPNSVAQTPAAILDVFNQGTTTQALRVYRNDLNDNTLAAFESYHNALGIVPKMVITSRGRVGINTDNPQREIHVKPWDNNPATAAPGYIRIEGNGSDQAAILELYHTRSNGSDKWPSSVASVDGGLTFKVATGNNGAPQEKLRIKSNGHIVLGSDGTNSELTFTQDGTSGTQLNATTTGSGGYNTLTINSASFIHKYGTTVRHLTNSSGKHGINNSDPKYAMHLRPADGESRLDLHMTNDTTGHTNVDGVQFGYQDTKGAYIWNFENTPIYMATNNVKKFEIHATGSTQIYKGDLLLGPDNVSQMEATIRAWGCSLWYTTIDPNYYHDSGGEFRQFYNKGSAAGNNYLSATNCSIQGSIGPQNRVFWRGAAANTRAEGTVDVSVGYRGAWFFIGQTSCSSIPFQGSGRYLYDSNSPSRVSVSFDSFGGNIDSGELSFHCGSTAGYNSGNGSVGGRLGSSSSDTTLRMYCVGVNMENYNAPNSKRAGNHLGISVMNNDGTDYGSSRLSENLINNNGTGGTNSGSTSGTEFNWGNRHSNDRGATTTFRHSQIMYFDDVQLNSAQWDYLEHYFKVMYG